MENMRYSGLSKKKRRLLVGSTLVLLLVIGGFIQRWYFDDSQQVNVGPSAEARLASYPWQESPQKIQLVHDPLAAFHLRRRLIREATERIEISTFLWRADETGTLLVQDLVAAAERGVRVRILGDGVFFMREPAKVAAIAAASSHLELRLYNPQDNKAASLEPSSFENMVLDFSSFNQRLHMKILLVDGEQALVGGRNVGNNYFGLDEDFNFTDRDILIQGDAVGRIAEAFELFWSDRRTTAAARLEDVAAAEADEAWLAKPVRLDIPAGDDRPGTWWEVDRVAVWYDRPGLIGDDTAYRDLLLADRLTALVGAAEESVVIETPYLVLSDRTRTLLERMRAERPEVAIRFLTNSLASTDTWQAYAAFQKQLRSMLELRLFLHLKKPQSLKDRAGRTGATASMHAKTILVDGREAAIGSFNWDPRSEIWNAEIMVVIDDQAFSRHLSDYMAPLWSPEASWVVAERNHPIGVEQVEALGAAVNEAIAEMTGIDLWPLTNAACFEHTGDKIVSPYDPEFYDNYTEVGSFPEVPLFARKRILTNLLEPVSGTLAPAL